jgi:hypothetical protein
MKFLARCREEQDRGTRARAKSLVLLYWYSHLRAVLFYIYAADQFSPLGIHSIAAARETILSAPAISIVLPPPPPLLLLLLVLLLLLWISNVPLLGAQRNEHIRFAVAQSAMTRLFNSICCDRRNHGSQAGSRRQELIQ